MLSSVDKMSDSCIRMFKFRGKIVGLIKKSDPFVAEYRTSKEEVFGNLEFHITAT